jgi:glycosyltransferase involved in cell wall biosynthesis
MLSVICPTYNRAYILPECVTPFMEFAPGIVEVIIVDDCSLDDTQSVCSSLACQFGMERIRYTRLDRNCGAQVARNVGISVAYGQCIMFVDSDDKPQPNGIAELLAVLSARPDLDFVYGKVLITDKSFTPLSHCSPIGSSYVDTCVEIGGYHWHTMGAIYRRACIQRVGLWNPALTGSQDWEYQARVKIGRSKGLFVDVIVGYWRQHEGSRVGARVFRADYVKSVMTASDSILSNAFLSGRCDSSLELRIAKKLFVHALEWGINGYVHERQACLKQAAGCFSTHSFYRVLLSLYAYVPSLFDRPLRDLILASSKFVPAL